MGQAVLATESSSSAGVGPVDVIRFGNSSDDEITHTLLSNIMATSSRKCRRSMVVQVPVVDDALFTIRRSESVGGGSDAACFFTRLLCDRNDSSSLTLSVITTVLYLP